MTIKLCKIFGFPIEIDWTWFIVFFLAVGAIRMGILENIDPTQYSSTVLLVAGVVGSLLFFASLLGHELSHSWVARQLGIPIAGITLFIFGGVARIKGEPQHAGDELKMALAGPLFSVVAGGFFYLLWGAQLLPPLWASLAWYLAALNAIVALFNLVPAFPMDGGRVLRALLWSWTGNFQRATRFAAFLGGAFGWLLIVWGVFLFVGGILGIPGGDVWEGVWLGFIGLFVHNAAQSSYQQVLWQKAMRGLLVRDLMNRDPSTVSPDTTLEEAVANHFLREPTESIPVTADGVVQGALNLSDVREVQRDLWPTTSVGTTMRPVSPDCFVAPTSDAWDVLSRVGQAQACVSPLMVVEDGKLVGTITQETLARQLRLRMQIQA